MSNTFYVVGTSHFSPDETKIAVVDGGGGCPPGRRYMSSYGVWTSL